MRLHLNTLTLGFCETQGRLFERAVREGLDSAKFIEAYMNSVTCERFNSSFDHLQWAGDAYILAELLDETPVPKGKTYRAESMYWIGYTYQYWHLYTKESGKEIYSQADAQTMNLLFEAYHTLDVAMAIDRIKEEKAIPHSGIV